MAKRIASGTRLRVVLIMAVAASIIPALGAATGWLAPGSALAAGTLDVRIRGFAFSPSTVTIQAGTTVRWTNLDTVAHTTTSDSGVWDSGPLNTNQTFSYTFDRPGTYNYSCTIHPTMRGSVIVQAAANTPVPATNTPVPATSVPPPTATTPATSTPAPTATAQATATLAPLATATAMPVASDTPTLAPAATVAAGPTATAAPMVGMEASPTAAPAPPVGMPRTGGGDSSTPVLLALSTFALLIMGLGAALTRKRRA